MEGGRIHNLDIFISPCYYIFGIGTALISRLYGGVSARSRGCILFWPDLNGDFLGGQIFGIDLMPCLLQNVSVYYSGYIIREL